MKPHLTEKTYKLAGLANPQFTLLVKPKTTKNQVKSWLKEVYQVDAIAIRWAKTADRLSRKRKHAGIIRGKIKAIVQLKDKQTIADFTPTEDKSSKKAKKDAKK